MIELVRIEKNKGEEIQGGSYDQAVNRQNSKNKGPNLRRFGPHVKLYTRAGYEEGI